MNDDDKASVELSLLCLVPFVITFLFAVFVGISNGWVLICVYIALLVIISTGYEKLKSGDSKNTASSNARYYRESGRNSNICSHSWEFTHKGADKKWPRGHYRCSRCGARGIEENYGDGKIIKQ